MKEKFKNILYKFTSMFAKHLGFVVACIFLAVASMVVYRLFVLSTIEPNQDYISDQKLDIKTVKFDEDAIKKIEALRDSNVDNPGTNIQKNRQNPFAE